jgi:hypothetical protein
MSADEHLSDFEVEAARRESLELFSKPETQQLLIQLHEKLKAGEAVADDEAERLLLSSAVYFVLTESINHNEKDERTKN